jgi:hypothetical protein
MKKCPDCGILWEDSEEHCQQCGRPLGEACRLARRSENVDSGPGAGQVVFVWFMELFPGLASVKAIICSLLAFALSGVGFALAFWLFAFGAALTGFAAGGGAMILYWSAWSWILYGDVCSPVEALAELQSRQWFVLMLVTVVPMGLAIWGMKQAAAGG